MQASGWLFARSTGVQWLTFAATDRPAAQGDSVEQQNVVADNHGFADHHAPHTESMNRRRPSCAPG